MPGKEFNSKRLEGDSKKIEGVRGGHEVRWDARKERESSARGTWSRNQKREKSS